MRLVFLGLAGAGKGTQAQLLSEQIGLAYISSGDMFRFHLANNTTLGQLAKSYMGKGDLVPDDVTIGMIADRINQGDTPNGFILDGFPRTVAQAHALDKILGSEQVDKVLYIKVSEEELVRRLAGRLGCHHCNTPYHVDSLPADTHECPKCGSELHQRQDDQPDIVKQRLHVQWPEITKLIGYYTKQSKLTEINGEQTVEQVQRELAEAIS